MPKVIVVCPTIRPSSHKQFCESWKPLFEKHSVTLITVWDGESPEIEISRDGKRINTFDWTWDDATHTNRDLFYRFTDGIRNIGFVAAAQMMDSSDDVLLTLDDDCYPLGTHDPIQAHINTLNRRCSISWMNTAHDTDLYLRGVPYGVRDEAPVMLSHGVWVGTPDFDGEMQLQLEGWEKVNGEYAKRLEPDKYMLPDGTKSPTRGVPYSLPYYVGPIPKGTMFPVCGMNLAVKRDAIPYLYFAPMGKDTGIMSNPAPSYRTTMAGLPGQPDPNYTVKGEEPKPLLNRFADIWMGIHLKKEFDKLGWAMYTGASTVLHTRASDAKKNYEQEKLGREWNEEIQYLHEGQSCSWDYQKWSRENNCPSQQFFDYFKMYGEKRERFKKLIQSIIAKGVVT